jgi:hypothetical protein
VGVLGVTFQQGERLVGLELMLGHQDSLGEFHEASSAKSSIEMGC